ncbi:MAG: sel1 repeat family protein [Ruminococcaceae bacterium]|nr:sel1 repeat family protein [Oscillospiraceae bacterium]
MIKLFEKNSNTTLKKIIKLANKGKVDAQLQLGNYYFESQNIEQSYEDAVKWYRRAAEQGYAPAQLKLGGCYVNARGVEKSLEKGIEWCRRAANQEYAPAQHELGYCYANGQGVAQSYAEAIKWYRKAAEKGYAPAQHELGFYYDLGRVVEQSYEEAIKWYRKAAEQGYDRSQHNLGYSYENGEGVKQSYEEAAKWYRKAAEQGSAASQYNLGNCYYYGRGVPLSRKMAIKWWRKAEEQGIMKARDALLSDQYYFPSLTESDEAFNETMCLRCNRILNYGNIVCPHCGMIQDTNLKIMIKDYQNIYEHLHIVGKVSLEDCPYDFSQAVELKRSGRYIEANRFYIDLYKKTNVIYIDMALGWYKVLASGGAPSRALNLLSRTLKPLREKNDIYTPEQILHFYELIFRIEGIGDCELNEYLAAISGNSNYTFDENKIDVVCQKGKYMDVVEDLKVGDPRLYRTIFNICNS